MAQVTSGTERLPLSHGIFTYAATAVAIGSFLYHQEFACAKMIYSRGWSLTHAFSMLAWNMSPALIFCLFALLFRSAAAEWLLAIGSIAFAGFWFVVAYEFEAKNIGTHCQGMGWIVVFGPMVFVPVASVIAIIAAVVHTRSQKR